MLRKIWAIGLIFVMALGLVACGTNEEVLPPGTPKDEIVYHIKDTPNVIDPAYSTLASEWSISVNIYDPLFKAHHQDYSQIEPWLVESYDVSEDYLEWRFELRQGVPFHNGEVLTAEDVVYSLERARTSAASAQYLSSVSAVEKTGDYSFVIRQEWPSSTLLETLASHQFGIVNKALMETHGTGSQEALVGTGAFRFVEWDSGGNVVLEATGDYWAGIEAPVQKVTFRPISNYSVAGIALKSGEVDVICDSVASNQLAFIEDDAYTTTTFYRDAVLGLALNSQSPVLSDVRVRRALNYGMDKDEMNILMAEGTGDVGVLSKVPLGAEGYGISATYAPVGYDYDHERALALMQEAGYEENDLTLTFITTSDTAGRSMGTSLQGMYSKIGIVVAIEPQDSAQFAENLSLGLYEGAITEWVFPTHQSQLMYYRHFHSQGAYNYEQVRLPRLDSIVDTALREPDAVPRNELYAELLHEVSDQAYSVPILHPQAVVITRGLVLYPDNTEMIAYLVDAEWP